MIIKPGQDFGVVAVGESPVGHVGLPHLVGEVGLKPDVGALGAFFRLWCDESG